MEHPTFFQQDLNHKHILVRAALRNPPTCPVEVQHWMEKMVDAVGMKILLGPHMIKCESYGNEGVTGVVCIETSHSSIHVWEKASIPFAMFDLYSCKDFDHETIIHLFKEFDPYYICWTLINRNPDTIGVINSGAEQIVPISDLMSSEGRKNFLAAAHIPTELVTDEMRAARAEYIRLKRKYHHSQKIWDNNHHKKYRETHRAVVMDIKSRAKKAGIAFDLTVSWYAEQLKIAQDTWSKLTVHPSSRDFWAANVDRVNPSLGYTQSNCRIIPYGLNLAKSNWNDEELEELKLLLDNEIKQNQARRYC